MKQCDARVFLQCPYHKYCGVLSEAVYAEGSECDKYNEEVLTKAVEKKKG